MELKGITIDLYERVKTGTDDLGNPIVAEIRTPVENVLVAPMSDQEILDHINLTGRKAIYQLAIPKGDTHDWTNAKVGFFGQIFQTVGSPLEGIEEMLPLPWNKKVRVEIIEGE